MKKVLFLALAITLLAVNFSYAAGRGRGKVSIPPHAVEVAPGIFKLGTAVDRGKVVEGYAIITRGGRHFARPCNNDGICDPGEKENCGDCVSDPGDPVDSDTSKCYDYTRGVKWKSVEDIVVNASNTRGLSEDYIVQNLSDDTLKWEMAAGTYIFGNVYSTTNVLEADLVQPDDVNEVYFASIDEPGAIAITIVWGVFGGPPSGRGIVEWDQVYDDVDFDWSEDCTVDDCTSKMDFESIATHELGHSLGLWDLYNEECSTVTMFGYAGYGETNKRILEAGDINGASELYK